MPEQHEKWEAVGDTTTVGHTSLITERFKLPGGWLVRTVTGSHDSASPGSLSTLFIKDAGHDWKLTE